MRRGLVLAAAVALVPGCATPVTDRDIDWRFPALSKQGCPDLTGKYINNKKLFILLTGGLLGGGSRQGTRIEDVRPLPVPEPDQQDRTVYFTRIKQTASNLEAVLIDNANTEYIRGVVSLEHARIGCQNGAMIIRRLGNVAKAESAAGSADVGETEFRRLPDGGIEAVDWARRYLRSNLTGKATTKTDEKTTRWTFPPAPH